MSTERAYEAALVDLEQELDGFVGAALVVASSGLLLAVHSVEPGLDQRALVGAARATLRAYLELGKGERSAQPDEVIVTTGAHIHLHQLFLPDVLLIVTASRDETNLALVKANARRCSERLLAQEPSSSTAAASMELQ